ncbi:MAG: peptidyl-prolyl cis-trans isomerase [Candidatus Sulfotelmatobacter sp.]
MRKSWLLCVLMGTMAWGQAQPAPAQAGKSTTTAPQAAPSQGNMRGLAGGEAQPPAPAAEVPESTVVLTIYGVCPPPSTAAASKAADGKTAASKTSAAKKSADCKTTMTRAEFEKLAKGLSPTPNVSPQLKRQLAGALPKFMAMSEAAKKQGLEQTEGYKETLKIAKMQILTTQLQRKVQEEANNVPDSAIDKYYKDNPEAYEQFSLDRLFVPRYKQENAEKSTSEEKLTDEQQKAKEAADKAKQEQGEQELKKLADTLRERAAAGEDFTKLQKEAFDAAGMKMDSPNVNLPKVRRTGLPPAHVAVFDLKVGEVSQVITDNGGNYIYKVVSKEVLPLDQVKEEIHNTLKSQRMKDMMDKYTNSYHADTNEAYFGPPVPTGPGGRPMPPRPRPNIPPPPAQGQPQPQAAPPAQQQAPPPKPN